MSAVMEAAVQAPQVLEDETEVVGEQRMLLHNIRWKTYERLCEDLGDQSHFRMWYDHGELEIMSPMLNH